MLFVGIMIFGGWMMITGSIPIRGGSTGGNWMTRVAGALFLFMVFGRWFLDAIGNSGLIMAGIGIVALGFLAAGIIKELSPPVL